MVSDVELNNRDGQRTSTSACTAAFWVFGGSADMTNTQETMSGRISGSGLSGVGDQNSAGAAASAVRRASVPDVRSWTNACTREGV